MFGPKDYSRTTGKPEVATDGFSVLNPGAFYVLHVYNGGKSGQFPGRASSAVIGLNGVEVVGPAAFNQQLWHIERPVELPNNQLTVEMRSKPGSGMTIEIIGIDNDPQTIVAVVSPPPNAAGWNNSNVTVSFECGDAHSGIAFCSSPVVISSEGAGQVVTGTAVGTARGSAIRPRSLSSITPTAAGSTSTRCARPCRGSRNCSFDSERKRMTTVHQRAHDVLVTVKDAPEDVLPLCIDIDGSEWHRRAEQLAAEGRRVLALAARSADRRAPIEQVDRELHLLGLVGLIDPPRPEARAAVAECVAAGIAPMMITGDHPATALAISRSLGIADGTDSVVTGGELERLGDAELRARLEHARVFARVGPAQPCNSHVCPSGLNLEP